MSNFSTRVELHNARSAEDYQMLHDEMAKDGFWRTIRFEGDSTVYQLPTAEYNFSGDVDVDHVRDLAKKAATRTGKTFSILVTKADGGRAIYNLAVVKKQLN
jgi:hypothetical protein